MLGNAMTRSWAAKNGLEQVLQEENRHEHGEEKAMGSPPILQNQACQQMQHHWDHLGRPWMSCATQIQLQNLF